SAPFECLDMGIGSFERLVLHQHGLDQRVDRVGCAGEPFGNGALGIGIARLAFKPGEAIEQIGDELTFLRGHRALLWMASAHMGAHRPAGNGLPAVRFASSTPTAANAPSKRSLAK